MMLDNNDDQRGKAENGRIPRGKNIPGLVPGRGRKRKGLFNFLAMTLLFLLFTACSGGGSSSNGSDGRVPTGGVPTDDKTIVVNSLEDVVLAGRVAAEAVLPRMTLREAIDKAEAGWRIVFDPSLNGKTINLVIIGESHSILKGEVFNPGFSGYQERDYGKSAFYARKDLIIDASSLPDGITIRWTGGEENQARVLAVYGNLTLKNVTVTSGSAKAEAIAEGSQPFTLARGGGLAVWGTAILEHCTLSGNKAEGDTNAARDRGAFGGGIYGNALILKDCIVSGNSVKGYGAAGGGVYSVGGGDGLAQSSTLTRTAVTGNRVTAQHAYGGGVYSDGGGPGNRKVLTLENCTLARNLVEDHPAIPQEGQFYYRGGGAYMSNGSLWIAGCTIVENAVTGNLAVFNGKPNMGGGGITATIGNAHVVEDMRIRHSIITGNTVNGVPGDVYTGSLVYFYSYGYNRIGVLDFSQILVPIPPWWSLSRKHWPKVEDQEGVGIDQVLDLSHIERHESIISSGTDEGGKAVLWYPPQGSAVDQIPTTSYRVEYIEAQYTVPAGQPDDFLDRILQRLRGDDYFAAPDFGKDIAAWTAEGLPITWQGEYATWPSLPANAAWIKFWRDLDTEIGGRLDAVGLGDDFWGAFRSDPLWDNFLIDVGVLSSQPISLFDSDQRGAPRPSGSKGDIGAIEGFTAGD